MIFKFSQRGPYIEAWEYLMRINEGFACDPENYIIEIRPIDHDQLPIYDEEVVKRLKIICGESTNADAMRAREIKQNRK